MNTRTFLRIRKTISVIGILSILSSLVVSIPTASAYSGEDAVKSGLAWAKDAVDQACEKGLIDCELPDPGFKTIVNRAVGYQMLTKGFGVHGDNAKCGFSDLKSDDWFYAAACTANVLGWTSGVGEGKFGSASTMTRAQLAVAASAVLGLEADESGLDGYDDKGSVPAWAKGAMGAMVKAKLMGQGGSKKLRPNEGAIKAEVITVLNAQVDYAEENDVDVWEVAVAHYKSAFDAEVTADNLQAAVDEGKMFDKDSGEFVAVEEAGEEGGEEAGEEGGEEAGEEGGEEAGEEGGEVAPPPPPAGSLSVALAPDSPAAKTVNPGATGVPFASFLFSVPEGEATLDSISFKRVGGGAASDFSAVSLYQGAKRLKAGKTVSTDTNLVDFSSLALKVTKDAPVTLMLKGDLTTTAGAASTHQFEVEAATSVTSTAGSVVGTFPVISNVMTIGGATAGTVTIATVNTLSKPTLGQKGAEVGNFKLTAGSNDISFGAITLTHGGTVARSNLSNFKLTDSTDSTKVLASAAALDGDLLVLTLTARYTVPKNNNRSFRVWADIGGGKTSDTLDFYLDETTDLDSVDSTINLGARVTNSLTKALVTDTTFQGGKITLADNGPAASNVATNTTNVELFNFSLTSDRNVTVRDYYLWLEQTGFDAATAIQLGTTTDYVAATTSAIATTGAVSFALDDALAISRLGQYDVLKVTSGGTDYYIEVSATPTTATVTGTLKYPTSVSAAVNFANTDDVTKVFDKHLRTRVKNLKLIDKDAGGTIASVTNTSYINVFSDDFDLKTGVSRNFSVRADLDSGLVAQNAFRAGVDFAESSFIKDPDANEFIATSDVVAGNTFGKAMTAVASSLTVSRASTPVTETHVKGQDNVDLLGLSVKAGDGGDVKVSKVTVRLTADDDGNTQASFENTGYGDTAANTIVETASLYKVNSDNTVTKVAGPAGLSLVGTIGSSGGYYKAEFASLSYMIAKGVTEKWLVRVKLKNTLSATRYVAADLVPGTDIEAQDKDGNTVTPQNGAASTTASTNILLSGASTVTIKTVATSGTLIGVQEGSPDAGLLVAGSTGNVVAKYKFIATNEAFNVGKLDVVGTTSAAVAFNVDPANFSAGNSIIRVGLTYNKKDGASETVYSNLSSGKASFTNLNIYVPKDGSAVVNVVVDTNTTEAGATSGASFRLGLNEMTGASNNSFEAQGEGSNEKKTVTDLSSYSSSSSVNAFVLRKTVPTVAKLATAVTKLTNGTMDIAAITVAADAKEAVSLKRIAFEFSSITVGVSALEFYRKIGSAGTEAPVTASVSIRNRAGQNLKSGGTALASDGTSATDTIYVAWDKTISSGSSTDQETITKGFTNTYLVRGTISGATTGESISTNIADDTTILSTTGGVAKYLTLNGVSSGNVESSDASVNNTRLIWRWMFNDATNCPISLTVVGCVFLDRNGNGSYTTATDPVYVLANPAAAGTGYIGTTATSTLASGAVMPGALYWAATALNGATGEIYWDLGSSGFGAFTTANDVYLTVLTSLSPTAGLVTTDFRFAPGSGTGVYIDRGDGNTLAAFSANTADAMITSGNSTTTTAFGSMTDLTSSSADTELFSASSNFIWSDNSNTAHSTSTGDWTNGTDVTNLPTQTLTLSF